MLVARRLVVLDVTLMAWGLGTWLGVNGLFMQLPLLVERLPEGWALPASMSLAVQCGNVGLLIYGLLRRLRKDASDSPYIYGLLSILTLALALNSFLYPYTVTIGDSERSIPFIALTFCVAFVGCTSSVLYYPYMRHFKDMYLATYLVGEGLSGFVPGLLALAQGVGGDPECVLSADNTTMEAHFPPPRFNSTVFILLLSALAVLSLAAFTLLDRWEGFAGERISDGTVAKEEEAAPPRASLLSARWATVMGLMLALNALQNGTLPSVQSYSCMPYGTRAYHLAVTLGAMANPAACLAGVWLPPVRGRSLAALLLLGLAPVSYILVTARMSPAPPLHTEPIGEALIVLSWVCGVAVLSYARMWVYGWARGGGARGMRLCGAVGQAGSLCGSVTLFALVNFTQLFTQPDRCPPVLPA